MITAFCCQYTYPYLSSLLYCCHLLHAQCHNSPLVLPSPPQQSLLGSIPCVTLGLQEQQVKRDRAAQIADHRRVTNAVDRCPLCFSSTCRPRHLTISLGQTAYLALPARSDLIMRSCMMLWFAKPAFVCGSSMFVSCHLLCVCHKHVCLLLSERQASSRCPPSLSYKVNRACVVILFVNPHYQC